MNSYDLSRKFTDFSFENPSKIKPNHYALYFFAIEHCNRLGWKQEFGLPTTMTMEAIGIRSYNTYINTFSDLVEFGFFKLIEKSKNQYSSNIIELSNFDKALDKALDKAFIKHGTKQSESTEQSIDSIIKQITSNQYTKEQVNKLFASIDSYLNGNKDKSLEEFEYFWNFYGKKIDKDKCQKKWLKLTTTDKAKIFETVQNYVKVNSDYVFRKNPLTYLNGKCWNDEIKVVKPVDDGRYKTTRYDVI
jgi:hypothetical protein